MADLGTIKICDITQLTRPLTDDDLLAVDANNNTVYTTASLPVGTLKTYIFDNNGGLTTSFAKINASIDATGDGKTATVNTAADSDNSNNAASTEWVNKFWTKQKQNANTVTGNWTFNGSLTTALSANRVVVTDANKKLTYSSIDTTKLGYLSDVTKNIQSQIDLKAPLAAPNFTGNAKFAAAPTYSSATSETVAVFNKDKKLVSSSINTAKLGYLSDVTGPIQGQLNNKAENNKVVHNTGTEDISGYKKFTNVLTATASPKVYNQNVTKGVSPTDVNSRGSYVEFVGGTLTGDYKENRLGLVGTESNSANYVVTSLWAYENIKNSGASGSIRVYADRRPTSVNADGSTYYYATCPIPKASSSKTDTKITTIGWVNDPDKASNVVHRDGNETITGTKEFLNNTLVIKNTNFNRTSTTANTYSYIYSRDSRNKNSGYIEFGGNKDACGVTLGLTNSDGNYDGALLVRSNNDGTDTKTTIETKSVVINGITTVNATPFVMSTGGNGGIMNRNTSIASNSVTPTVVYNNSFKFASNDNDWLGGMEETRGTDGTTQLYILTRKKINGTNKDSGIILKTDVNGNSYARLTASPASNSNDTSIATTQWVNDKTKIVYPRTMVKCIEVTHATNFPMTVFNSYTASSDIANCRRETKEFTIANDSFVTTWFYDDCAGEDGATLLAKLPNDTMFRPISMFPMMETSNSVFGTLHWSGDLPGGTKIKYLSPWNQITPVAPQFDADNIHFGLYVYEYNRPAETLYSPFVVDYDSFTDTAIAKGLLQVRCIDARGSYGWFWRMYDNGLREITLSQSEEESERKILYNGAHECIFHSGDNDTHQIRIKKNTRAGDVMTLSKDRRYFTHDKTTSGTTNGWDDQNITVQCSRMMVSSITGKGLTKVTKEPKFTIISETFLGNKKGNTFTYSIQNTGYIRLNITINGDNHMVHKVLINNNFIGLIDNGNSDVVLSSFYINAKKGDTVTLSSEYYKYNSTTVITNDAAYNAYHMAVYEEAITDFDETSLKKLLHYDYTKTITHTLSAWKTNNLDAKIADFKYTFPSDGYYDVYFWCHNKPDLISEARISNKFIGHVHCDNSDVQITRFRVHVKANEILTLNTGHWQSISNYIENYVSAPTSITWLNYFIVEVTGI